MLYLSWIYPSESFTFLYVYCLLVWSGVLHKPSLQVCPCVGIRCMARLDGPRKCTSKLPRSGRCMLDSHPIHTRPKGSIETWLDASGPQDLQSRSVFLGASPISTEWCDRRAAPVASATMSSSNIQIVSLFGQPSKKRKPLWEASTKKKNATDSLLAITPFSESDLPDGADSVARVDCVVALIAN
jgi:hypothetical protein